jgi:predicted RNA-binding protein with PIN domain
MVFVDAENVRRSTWPNVGRDELVRMVERWSERERLPVRVVFDGSAPAGAVGTAGETADDLIAREAAELAARGEPFWLVTSDRGLRTRVATDAERVIGGGAFVRDLIGRDG